MKKRMLLILVIGITFTPAVFAKEKVRSRHTGELSKLSDIPTDGAITCRFAANKGSMPLNSSHLQSSFSSIAK